MDENVVTVDNSALFTISKQYKIKLLPKDTPLETIIEFLNILQIQLCPAGNPDIQHFIDDHPDLVEEVSHG
ncbi:unnamed protein product [marine sediment metagenome]|uniref:Uncharacterized protein n=1 Tax=marine sediment metagenome TaxID=412755 RepID=X0ZZX0_9ZZZZ